MPKRCNNKQSKTKNDVVVTPPSKKKKTRPILTPPKPNKRNQLDIVVPKLNVSISAPGYGIGFATKGPPSSSKAYTKPAEQRVTDPADFSLNEELTIYGMVKLRGPGGSNIAKKHYWKDRDGATKSCDWTVSHNI